MLARALVGRNSAISADPEMIGCGQSRTPLQLCAARNCSVIQSTPNGAGGRHGCWPRGLPFLVIRARPALHLAEPLGISARDDAVEPAFTMKIAQQRRDVARASAWAAQPLGNVQDARPNASAQPSTRTTRWMPILQRAANRGLGLSSACLLSAGSWRRRLTMGPLDSQPAATILQTESSRRSTTTDEKCHPRPHHRPAA
jgi:hypothetical protein